MKADLHRQNIHTHFRIITPDHNNLFPQDDVVSPSSASEDEDSEKKQPKKLNQNKIRKKLSRFFKLRLDKEKDKDEHGAHPQKPNTLPFSKKAEPAPVSPSKCHYISK